MQTTITRHCKCFPTRDIELQAVSPCSSAFAVKFGVAGVAVGMAVGIPLFKLSEGLLGGPGARGISLLRPLLIVLFSDCGRLSGPNQSLHGIRLNAAEKCREYHETLAQPERLFALEMPMMSNKRTYSEFRTSDWERNEGSDLEIDKVRNS